MDMLYVCSRGRSFSRFTMGTNQRVSLGYTDMCGRCRRGAYARNATLDEALFRDTSRWMSLERKYMCFSSIRWSFSRFTMGANQQVSLEYTNMWVRGGRGTYGRTAMGT